MTDRFSFKCDCTEQEKADWGCLICDTDHFLGGLSSPLQIPGGLTSFCNEQAIDIADEVYHPLLDVIKALSAKIDQLEQELIKQGGK